LKGQKLKHSYIGALHVHSLYSDGRKDVDHIIKQAQRAGLKWLIITDHNNLDALKHEGFYGDLCVIAGCEITPLKGNHLLAFNINEVINENLGARNYIDEVHKQGGFCFPAHPDESIARDNKQKPLRWDDWSIDSFDGLEIWNYLTDWTDGFSIHKNQLLQYFNRHNLSTGPTGDVLAWWDRLNKTKDNIVPAIAGVDAHAFEIGRHGLILEISDYYDFFKSLNNMLVFEEPLSKTYEIAREQILNALKQANNIIVNRRVTNNTDIDFSIVYKDKKFVSGESLEVGKYAYINVSIPKKATIRLFHNGVLVYEIESKVLKYDKLDIGKYRLEVYYKNKPWIFANPIKILGEQLAYTDGLSTSENKW